ncbi:NAD-dependent epimerase/dehydratase family protein [Streptomyces sp. SID2131]|nr:NAD-dependent epimerase/dehydratase family protein [Streptomyces sp. SID2131]
MRPRRLVLTGATGFIGSAVLRELERLRDEDIPEIVVRAVGRRLPRGLRDTDEWVDADLADPRTLAGVCEGADALLHLAALVNADERSCLDVNVRGNAALMDEAVRAGVSRVVHLSTAAVYGLGPHRNIAVDAVEPVPLSAASRTRLAGESAALAAGATVLRPGLVIGPGDRWVVPALAELLDAVPAWWDAGRAKLSLVAVEDLARLIARLGLDGNPPGGRVWHAGHPEPVGLAEFITALAHRQILSPPMRELSLDASLRRLRASGIRLSERQFLLFAQDFWFDSREIWTAAACPPGPGPLDRLTQAAQWYRSLSTGRAA